jgi:two-component system, cell cycle sensor histidine kinase and response regulator CckA
VDNTRIRVLLIEDDEDDYILVRKLLSQITMVHYDLQWAPTYGAALEAIDRGPHDVYLLDYRLGERTGLEFLHEINAKGSAIPVVFLTGHADYGLDIEAMRAGASDYLVKGQINSDLLERSIRYAIERKRLEEQLRRVQKLEALGTLAGGIAHDFNNILAGIIGFTEMVLEDIEPDGPEHTRLRLVLKGANRGRDLVKQILAFSRKAKQDHKPLILSQTVEEGLKLLRPAIPSTIEIRSTSTTNDDQVLADASQMHQVLMNLCSNAAHAMRDKGGVLSIRISEAGFAEGDARPVPEMTPGDYVALEVGDTGSGMAPETLERIFDPFFTTKKPGEGTGLGLSVVHGILASHGGHITVESEPAKGTIFHVYLPKIAEHVLAAGGEAHSVTGGNERILLVDDEDLLVEMNKQKLARLGYEIVATTSSVDALAMFRKEPHTFDLVITDQTMPNLTGLDLAAELIKVRATIPIILCSGHSETVSPERAQETGIKAFLAKPLGKRDMAEAIRRVLDAKTEE